MRPGTEEALALGKGVRPQEPEPGKGSFIPGGKLYFRNSPQCVFLRNEHGEGADQAYLRPSERAQETVTELTGTRPESNPGLQAL